MIVLLHENQASILTQKERKIPARPKDINRRPVPHNVALSFPPSPHPLARHQPPPDPQTATTAIIPYPESPRASAVERTTDTSRKLRYGTTHCIIGKTVAKSPSTPRNQARPIPVSNEQNLATPDAAADWSSGQERNVLSRRLLEGRLASPGALAYTGDHTNAML